MDKMDTDIRSSVIYTKVGKYIIVNNHIIKDIHAMYYYPKNFKLPFKRLTNSTVNKIFANLDRP